VFVAAIRSDAEALADVARLGLDTEVPSCPGWTVRMLVGHLGVLHRWVTQIVGTRAQARIPRNSITGPAPDEDLVAWFVIGATALADQLEQLHPDEPVWNWSLRPNVGAFWPRRMAHETAIHRWDGQNAYGRAGPIHRALAADGVAEVLEVWLPSPPDIEPVTIDAVFRLLCTDIPSEWTFALRDGHIVEVGSEATTVTVSATASDLDLFMWGRQRPGATVEGDRAALDRLLTMGWSL